MEISPLVRVQMYESSTINYDKYKQQLSKHSMIQNNELQIRNKTID